MWRLLAALTQTALESNEGKNLNSEFKSKRLKTIYTDNSSCFVTKSWQRNCTGANKRKSIKTT